ncbi:hypothetical protein [Streptomyces sp. NPDC004629]|uniref:hypothetical protein n=1 Tax=Streptomyces sp. NPDC004629 TaxID=3364705 RepID=UPI0036C5A3E4
MAALSDGVGAVRAAGFGRLSDVRTARVYRHLSRPAYHGAQLAGQIRERIEDFNRVSPPHQIGPHVGLLALEA